MVATSGTVQQYKLVARATDRKESTHFPLFSIKKSASPWPHTKRMASETYIICGVVLPIIIDNRMILFSCTVKDKRIKINMVFVDV